MEEHDNVVKSLNQEFKKIDKAYQANEMRVFGMKKTNHIEGNSSFSNLSAKNTGKNTGQIFRELDVIRRKQINLASDHVSLEPINDIP